MGTIPFLVRENSATEHREDVEMELIPGDRRSSYRYALELGLAYESAGRRGPALRGTGRTIDLSSTGIAFHADTSETLPVGLPVRLTIEWPVPSVHGEPLMLVVLGKVRRSSPESTAIRSSSYDFRPAAAAAPSGGHPFTVRGGPVAEPTGQTTRVTVQELHSRLSALLKEVQNGGTVIVYRRHRPIAEIRPPAVTERRNRQPAEGRKES